MIKVFSEKEFEIKVTVISFFDNESNFYIAYIPAFDIIAQGETRKEALSEIKEILKESVIYAIRKKTLEKWLKSLGWKKVKSKTFEIEKTKPIPANFPKYKTSSLQIA